MVGHGRGLWVIVKTDRDPPNGGVELRRMEFLVGSVEASEKNKR